MNMRLTLPSNRIVTPVATVLMVIAFAATLALGFGLRAWTEPTPTVPSRSAVITQTHPEVPQPLMKKGRPW